ncbi:MAG: ATP-binding cassette domain-containing protein [Bacteroidetes bacterium]|nr:ATP-binding cassette domain-containing protein [Bacteroidota bacterium]
MDSNKKIILEVKGVTKTYLSTVALDNVSVSFEEGKVTSIYGPNGAGKSTLIKIICGVEKADKGAIFLKGKKVDFKTYKEALKNGISYLPQDFGLLNNLTVLENIAIAINQINPNLLFSRNELIKHIETTKNKFLPLPDINKTVEKLSAYEKQLLAIHKALFFKSDIIIFDESTTNLTKNGFIRFREVIETLKEQGKTIIFISHKLEEVFDISDNLLILKEGKIVKKDLISNINKTDILDLFLSKKKYFTSNLTLDNNDILCTVEMNIDDNFNFNFTIAKGEVIVLESTNTTLNQNIGYILFNKLKENNNLKVGLIPASREDEAIFSNLSIKDNLLIDVIKIPEFRTKKKQKDSINKIAKDLNLVYRDWEQSINELSGGNKQKIVFGKWILSNFDVLILIEPTSGVDIETKGIIHNKIIELKGEGKSFVLITSDEGEQEVLQTRKIILNEKSKII